MTRPELEAAVCKGVSDERLTLLLDFGGVQRCIDMVDWDKPEPTWTKREMRNFMEQLHLVAVDAFHHQRNTSTALILSQTFSPRITTVLAALALAIAEMAPDVLEVLAGVLDLSQAEIGALVAWGRKTQALLDREVPVGVN